MATEKMCFLDKNRNIMIAVDESENAKRALLYVADFLGGIPGFWVSILSVIPGPPVDYFKTDEERSEWINRKKTEAATLLDDYRRILVQSGFGENNIEQLAEINSCPSVADCILNERQRLNCDTLVIGRRGISKKEEFLFGSTSSKIVHSARNCAVWVIE